MDTLFFFFISPIPKKVGVCSVPPARRRGTGGWWRERERETVPVYCDIYIYSRGSGLLSQTMLLERRPRYQHYTRCVRRLTYNLIVLYFLLLFFFVPLAALPIQFSRLPLFIAMYRFLFPIGKSFPIVFGIFFFFSFCSSSACSAGFCYRSVCCVYYFVWISVSFVTAYVAAI